MKAANRVTRLCERTNEMRRKHMDVTETSKIAKQRVTGGREVFVHFVLTTMTMMCLFQILESTLYAR